MGNAITNPIGTIGKKTGLWNHKKQIIRDSSADQQIYNLNASRQNNNYVSTVDRSGVFANLEDSTAYKDWLVSNGPNNLLSPYYTSVEVQSKQNTTVIGFNGHPNVYINWEHRFNYNAYNLDLSNAEKAIQTCKNQIYEESNRFNQVISNSVADYNKQEAQIAKEKKDVEQEA